MTLDWNTAEARQLLTSTRGPVGSYLSRVVGPVVVREAKRRAPVSPEGTHGHEPGYLRDSIGQRLTVANDTVGVDVRARAFYGAILAAGAKSHEIAPKTRRGKRGSYPLRDKHGHVFGTHVNHPGTRPDHFLQDALTVLR